MYRITHSAIVVMIIAAMLFAVVYLEGVLYLAPCPLCMVNRGLLLIMALISLAAAIHNPTGSLRWLYSGLSLLIALAGMAVAGRHIWLQGLPPDKVPECGPDLAYMLDAFPLTDVIMRLIQGSGQCAEVSWTLLGLSLPQQTLLLLIVLSGMAIYAHVKSSR